MEELSSFENPRKNLALNSGFMDKEFIDSLKDPKTGEISSLDKKRIENR